MNAIDSINHILSQKQLITDGGLETSLIFKKGIDLPYFAAFDLLKNEQGKQTLLEYYQDYLNLAKKYESGFILESATWRASADWGEKLGYTADQLDKANREAIQLLQRLKNQNLELHDCCVISGCIGPRGDGYAIAETMTIAQAQQYHQVQIDSLKRAGVDMVSAFTMNYVEEALGIVYAAKHAKIPVVISFTVETNGCLPSGDSLISAIETVDRATNATPLYYMINCAHPTHFSTTLSDEAVWLKRIRGIRANASSCSHAELDEATELDEGDAVALGLQYKQLQLLLPSLRVFGGCCGTDHKHIELICQHCLN
ncbi:MAG: homocysteine S-methyltransferase family protein [Gammaproteobacteria bacterium]|nr:homocysteine S-methyltransferase family protein [Gammaproteobacteria bacterium]MDH5731355.1 homocysteine S-methyltransferase family protein [Gammaproteobacteria bacterium]